MAETFLVSARHYHLPTELLREVVHYYAHIISWRIPERARQSYKPNWTDYQPLTLASKVLRQLSLETWFEVYYAQSPEDLVNAWPEFSTWTRELHCVELGTDLQIRPVQWTLQAFRRLRKLRIDFDPSQSNAMLLMRFDHPRPIASHLQELEVHDVSWPSPMVVRLVSEAFPALRVLKLMQDLVWCGLCNTCRFATFKDHPPPEIMYEKTVGLPRYYETYLMSLAQLHTVQLTVAYGLGGLVSLSNNDVLWTGECDDCMDMMFPSWDGFKAEWVEQKKTMERPPSLKCVRWRFRHKNAVDVAVDLEEMESPSGQEEDDDEDDT
ncbi:uncharacterized protein TRAVEDRAFT_50214 [Trametes versicolor FP-101664 SS1]|uniref:uncharacterized protein n=1 Tax=Trametes versicolor (strain FP-101664) TaxID=717944 RepID=UPI0004622965|nr:uncharacterized protein TRAVEDRAFT_50214 [Trametes versicolor FP-101664 SS1]EIW55733.1 hypothetical protein TRAVEDRAFT_50214 [Trametes versicolor FP-101664 SS1]